MAGALFVHQPAGVFFHRGDGHALAYFGPPRPGIGQQREQGTALHAQTEQARIQPRVAHVHHRTAARRFPIQPAHPPAMRQRGIQQAQFPQHLQAGWLQQESGADRAQLRRAFEYLHCMSVARQQQRQCLPGSAVSDDGDMSFPHPCGVPLAHKKPRRSGVREISQRCNQSDGVTLPACAPFGPWVTS